MGGFRLLEVHSDGQTVFAVVRLRQLSGQEYREALEQDYCRLSELGVAAVRLDLRAVEYIDGAFISLLVELVKGLKAVGARLTVVPSPNLAEVFRILRLGQLFEVVSGTGDDTDAPRFEA